MPRAKLFGFILCVVSIFIGIIFFYNAFFPANYSSGNNLSQLHAFTYYSIAIPIGIIALGVLGTGLWVGCTILSIKVVPPMPELVEKKDYSRIKAFFLCLLCHSHLWRTIAREGGAR